MTAKLCCLKILQTAHTMHPDIVANPFHVGVVRNAMTRNLGECYGEIRTEIVESIAEFVPKSKGTYAPKALDLARLTYPHRLGQRTSSKHSSEGYCTSEQSLIRRIATMYVH